MKIRNLKDYYPKIEKMGSTQSAMGLNFTKTFG